MGGTIWNPDAGSVPPYRTVKKSPMAIRKNKPDAATETNPSADGDAAVFARFLAALEQAAEAGTPWLTEAGAKGLRRLVRASRGRQAPTPVAANADSVLPDWNAHLGQLWFGGKLVHKFSQRAPTQVPILDAFGPADGPRDPSPTRSHQSPTSPRMIFESDLETR